MLKKIELLDGGRVPKEYAPIGSPVMVFINPHLPSDCDNGWCVSSYLYPEGNQPVKCYKSMDEAIYEKAEEMREITGETPTAYTSGDIFFGGSNQITTIQYYTDKYSKNWDREVHEEGVVVYASV